MTSLHFDEFEMVTLQLSKDAYEILREIQAASLVIPKNPLMSGDF